MFLDLVGTLVLVYHFFHVYSMKLFWRIQNGITRHGGRHFLEAKIEQLHDKHDIYPTLYRFRLYSSFCSCITDESSYNV